MTTPDSLTDLVLGLSGGVDAARRRIYSEVANWDLFIPTDIAARPEAYKAAIEGARGRLTEDEMNRLMAVFIAALESDQATSEAERDAIQARYAWAVEGQEDAAWLSVLFMVYWNAYRTVSDQDFVDLSNVAGPFFEWWADYVPQ